jgi:hypothetical protein
MLLSCPIGAVLPPENEWRGLFTDRGITSQDAPVEGIRHLDVNERSDSGLIDQINRAHLSKSSDDNSIFTLSSHRDNFRIPPEFPFPA